MSGGWIKLDIDWRGDMKIRRFEEAYGKAALVDVVNLMCALGEFRGEIDMSDKVVASWVHEHMRMRAAAFDKLVARCAEFGIVDADAWAAFRKVTSQRARRDGAKRKSRADAAASASEAARLKRAKAREGPSASP